MAVTMAKSTFSQTSIVHGSCDYIPFDKKTYSKTPYDCVHLENNSGILKNRVHVYKGAEKEILVHGNDIEWNETIHYQRRIESTCGEQFKLPLTESHRALWWANITREILLVDVQCIREASLDFIDQYYFTSSDLDQKQQVNK
jgi:hypothetical protein